MDQTNYTLPGIMHYLQNQYTIIEKNKILNDLEKSELKLKITKLESERNSLILENSKLHEKIRQLQHKTENGVKEDSPLETIDTTNLVRARQFLKNTTNEILFLLNSPSIDNNDPLDLTKEEPDFLSAQVQYIPEVPPRDPSHNHPQQILLNTDDKIDTDAETITNDTDDEEEEEEEEETVVSDIAELLRPPINFMKVEGDVLYCHSDNESHLYLINLSRQNSETIILNTDKDIMRRVFAIGDGTLIEASSSMTQGFLSIGHEIVLTFENPIKNLDYYKNILAVLLDDGQVQIFQINETTIVPHEHCSLSLIPPETKCCMMKFNSEKEITIITTEGRILRYDFDSDALIYNLNIGINLSLNCRFKISSNFFIHEFNSSTLSILDLLSQELKTYPLQSPFQITSISTADKFFSLSYSDGTTEVYDLTSFQQDEEDQRIYHNKTTRLPNYLKKINYYQHYKKPSIIKDTIVDLVIDKDIKIYAIGTDMKVKEYIV